MLLAGIAEKASNKSFDSLLEEYIFTTAKMNNTKRDVFLKGDVDYAIGHQLSVANGRYYITIP